MKNHAASKHIFIPLISSLVIAVGFLLVIAEGARLRGVAPIIPIAPILPVQSSLVYAAQGELAPGFPAELIVDTNAKLVDSYSIVYEGNIKQYTARFDSQKSMAALYDTYQSYFSRNNWTITNQITKYPDSRGIYAVSGTNEAGVALMTQGTGTEVVVNYIVK